MQSAKSSATTASDAASIAWERRRSAAWLDYLHITRTADAREYEQVESNAWAQLTRRLARNDELRSTGTR